MAEKVYVSLRKTNHRFKVLANQVLELIVQHLVLIEFVHLNNKFPESNFEEIYTSEHESALLSAINNTCIYGEQTEFRFRSCSQDLETFALDRSPKVVTKIPNHIFEKALNKRPHT